MAPRMAQRGGEAVEGSRRRTAAQHQREVELEKVRHRAEVAQILARGVVYAISIAAFAVPLLALEQVIEPLAGKNTVINANIIVSISLTLSLAVNGLQYLKTRSQRSEVLRLRERVESLESLLLEQGKGVHQIDR